MVLRALLIVHGMLAVRIIVLGIGIGIVCRVRIGIIRMVCGGRGGVIVMLLVGIGVVGRCGSGGRRVVGGRGGNLLVSTALGLGGWLDRDASGGVLLHLFVESLLVLLSHLLVLRLVFRGEGAPPLAEDDPHVDELDTGVFLHHLGAHVEGEKDERATSALRLFGVLVLLHVLLVQPAVLNEVSRGVVSGGRG
jgi:hypothetical protein